MAQTSDQEPFTEINGWKLFLHPAFREPYEALVAEAARLKKTSPETYAQHPKAKLLKRIADLILKEIPMDPNATEYQLGNTIGAAHRHWRRAKFLQRFRLFYRFDSASKLIIYAWVNDENSLRKRGSRTDPYEVFKARLAKGDPPTGWEELLAEARTASTSRPDARKKK